MNNAVSKSDRRRAILRSAWHRFKFLGLAKTTISIIAIDVGIGKGTVYNYFKSKDEIILALAERANEGIHRQLVKIEKSSLTPQNKLRKVLLARIMAIFNAVSSGPHAEKVITSMKPKIVKRVDRFVKRQATIIEKILNEGVKKKVFKVRDIPRTAEVFAQTFELLTPPYYKYKSRKALETFANDLIDRLTIGIIRNKRGGRK